MVIYNSLKKGTTILNFELDVSDESPGQKLPIGKIW